MKQVILLYLLLAGCQSAYTNAMIGVRPFDARYHEESALSETRSKDIGRTFYVNSEIELDDCTLGASWTRKIGKEEERSITADTEADWLNTTRTYDNKDWDVYVGYRRRF